MRYTTIVDAGTHSAPSGFIFNMIKPGVFVDATTGKKRTRRPVNEGNGIYTDSGMLFIPETDPLFNYYVFATGCISESNNDKTYQYFEDIQQLMTTYLRKFIPDRMEAFRKAGGRL